MTTMTSSKAPGVTKHSLHFTAIWYNVALVISKRAPPRYTDAIHGTSDTPSYQDDKANYERGIVESSVINVQGIKHKNKIFITWL